MSIEAMKQALEALEGLVDLAHEAGFPCDRAEAAITSLRQAIEQAEKQEPVAVCEYCEKERPVIHAPAAPVQDPVAWVADGILMKIGIPEKYTGYLYTTPQPQREWVGLTDEEVQFVYADSGYNDIEMFAAAIEAKLKEKNT